EDRHVAERDALLRDPVEHGGELVDLVLVELLDDLVARVGAVVQPSERDEVARLAGVRRRRRRRRGRALLAEDARGAGEGVLLGGRGGRGLEGGVLGGAGVEALRRGL